MTQRRKKEDPAPVAPPDRSVVAALGAIPIFPLPQVVLFPEAVLPLHVFKTPSEATELRVRIPKARTDTPYIIRWTW